MTTMRIIECKYIGRSKERKPGEFSALGWANNQWSVILPEKVLREHFGDEDPTKEQTLYGVLNIKDGATADEIKTGYRRMALQWHPDTCREPNANDVFLRIQEAYNLLSNPIKRGKYDAGLVLSAKIGKSPFEALSPKVTDSFGYRSPLRCGLILAEGEQSGKYFVVSKIMLWNDITNSAGQTLIANWVYGEDRPQELWR